MQLWHVGSSSLTRDQAWTPCIGSMESQLWTTRKVSKFLFLVKIITSHRLNYGCKNVRQQNVNLCKCKCYTGGGNDNPLQYSCLENPMDGGVWWVAVHGVAKSRTRLSHFTFTFHFHALEKEMAAHSSVPAWRIPRMGEPGGLQSMGSHRVGHD